MRVRHKMPSIFNIYMVDTLCCALGCVILLWLLGLRETRQREERIEEEITATAAERDQAKAQHRDVSSRLDVRDADYRAALAKLNAREEELRDRDEKLKAMTAQAAALESDLTASRKAASAEAARADGLALRLDDANAKLKAAKGDLDAERKRLVAAGTKSQTLEADLKVLRDKADAAAAQARSVEADLKTARDKIDADSKRAAKLDADLAAARKEHAAEEVLSRALQKEIKQRQEDVTRLGRELEDLLAAKRSLERDLLARDKSITDLRGSRDKVVELEKLLNAADRRIAALEGEKKGLEAEARRFRVAADNRFAGIELTGKRVVFLVDMSGSMELTDELSPTPKKWLEVRNTVAKLMKSLPELEKFQVILFSEETSYLLGKPGQWLDYDAAASPDKAAAGLAAVRPKGGTNMYAGLEAAFALRSQGLDTIYLLSDGLPNMGEGLSPELARTVPKETDRSDILGKHVRKKLKTDWNRDSKTQPKVKINAVGFFYESPDVGAFLWALSRENDGSFVGMGKP